jgi:hypothetical protein
VIALGAALALLLGAAPGPAGPRYVVARTGGERGALLGASGPAWKDAPRIQWGPAPYETSFAARWNDDGLFVRFDARDPSPWSTMTRRDEHLWEEEVVEIFIDLDGSDRNYAEVEVNPAGVVCDVRMISPSPHKQMDIAWNLEGLDARATPWTESGRTVGWTATAFLPWSGLRSLPSAAHAHLPPRPGDAWRFNVFRVERPGGHAHPEQGAIEVAWSDPGEPSFHVPRAFRPLVFAGAQAAAGR